MGLLKHRRLGMEEEIAVVELNRPEARNAFTTQMAKEILDAFGGYWNHLQEMQDSYKGLDKIRKGLEGSLKNPNLDAATRKVLQDGLDKANKNIKKTEDLFEPFGGI